MFTSNIKWESMISMTDYGFSEHRFDEIGQLSISPSIFSSLQLYSFEKKVPMILVQHSDQLIPISPF